jgi:hypothetical protein
MATQGPNITGTGANGANNTGAGTVNWTNPTNVQLDDGSNAVGQSNPTSCAKFISCTNFGFSIPGGSTINGITVAIEIQGSTAFTLLASRSPGARLQLIKGGTIGGTNKIVSQAITTSMVTYTFGGAADLWGNILTDSDINSSNFGVAFSPGHNGTGKSNYNVSTDSVKITVDYTLGGSSLIKTLDGLAQTSTKTVEGLAIASVKNINGLNNV